MARKKFFTVGISGSGWPDDMANGVFVQWCIALAPAKLSLPQWSGPDKESGSITFSNPAEGLSFTIAPDHPLSWQITEIIGLSSQDTKSVVELAAAKTCAADSGTSLVYQGEMQCRAPQFDADMMLNFFRVLGDQKAISGPRRLSDIAILDFAFEPPSVQALFVPDTTITVTIFVPGPVQGPMATRIATGLFETVCAICALALGRPVDNPELAYFPIAANVAEIQLARRHDFSILGLARDSISLDIFGELALIGGPDAMIRARNAFITLHEAQRQANADVAVMLYVCAIEALISPGLQCKWRKEQVTKRFRDAVLSLCREAVDQLLAHQNMEAALGFQKRGTIERQRREVVDHVYDLRSLPTHTGIGLRNAHLMNLADERSIRVALLSDLARAALLAYMQAPRSFLTGHPAFRQPQT